MGVVFTVGLLVRMPGWSFVGDATAAAHAKTRTTGPINVRVSHGRFPTYGEPDVAVSPRNPRNLLAAALCIGGAPLRRVPCTFASFDGGRTWRENGRLPHRPGDAEGVDVSVGFNADGRAFVAGMSSPNSGADSVLVWRSSDGGASFSRPVTLYRGHTSDWGADHPWLTVADHGAYAGSVYVVWMEGRRRGEALQSGHLLFSRSVDGGRTFTKPRVIVSTPGQGAGGAVMTLDPHGGIHVFYGIFPLNRDPFRAPFPQVMRATVGSTDGGRTFGAPRAIGAAPLGLVFGRVNSDNLHAAAADPRDGTLYMVVAAYPRNSRHSGILLWRSRDQGTTWTGPIVVTRDSAPNNADDFQPRVVVTARGVVFVSYFRLAHGRIDVYVARSTSHGADFARSMRTSTVSFDPRLVPWIGDYQGLGAGPTAVYPLWNDTRTGQMQLFTAAVPALP